MKKSVFLLAIYLLVGLSIAKADEIIIKDVTIPQGGTVDLPVCFNFTSSSDKIGFTFTLNLPSGITTLKDADGDPVFVKDVTSIEKLNIQFPGEGNFAGLPANEHATIKGTSGTLLTLTLCADNKLIAGSSYSVSVTNCTFAQRVDGVTQDIAIDDFSFTITIGEPADSRTTLDETSISAPEASDGAVDVLVKRTINANLWSTICLPFGMTEAQMKEAFGNDVELADFVGCDVTYTDETEENVQSINVKFETVSAIEANHPYIIKVSEDIAEFTADDVIISPDEASVDCDPYAYTVQVGKNKFETRYFYNSFVGTYVSNFFVPEQCLFLNGNQFWYSTGATKMKAFRAYFDFYDVLTTGTESNEVKMAFIDGISTQINGVTNSANGVGDNIYDLSGRKVTKPQQSGVYIVNGKKAVIK